MHARAKSLGFLFYVAGMLICCSGQLQAGSKSPVLTTAAIIEVHELGFFKGIVLIELGKAPWGKALPDGKVEYGETVEEAVRREMMEEVNLELEDVRQFHVYSDPARDPRYHSVEVTHLAKAHGHHVAGDDAARAFIVHLDEIPWHGMAFDHAQILRDYLAHREGDTNVRMEKPWKTTHNVGKRGS